jgi:hypothetical protein
MINFWLAVRNPFKCADFRNFGCRGGQITQHKRWEVQFSHYAYNCAEIKLDFNWQGQDHAGPWITLNILGYTLDARIHDIRHWDDVDNCWSTA